MSSILPLHLVDDMSDVELNKYEVAVVNRHTVPASSKVSVVSHNTGEKTNPLRSCLKAQTTETDLLIYDALPKRSYVSVVKNGIETGSKHQRFPHVVVPPRPTRSVDTGVATPLVSPTGHSLSVSNDYHEFERVSVRQYACWV